jgi:hypothetical protein
MIMKTLISVLVILFALCRANANTNKIPLNMEKGHEYIYDWVVKNYLKYEDRDSSNLTIHHKVLRMEVVDATPGKEITLKVNLLKNYREVPNSILKNKTDYFFPDYFDDMGAAFGRDLSEELFSRVNFVYRLNLIESTLELVNWTELLIEMSDLLYKYGYDDDVRQIQIDDLKNKRLHEFSTHVWFLMDFNSASILSENQVARSDGEDKLPFQPDREGNLVITSGKDELSAGNKFSRNWLNSGNGQVIRMIKKVYHERKGLGIIGGSWNVTETNASLIKSGIPKPKTLFVSGTVSNPVSNKIHITYLERPFGIEMRKRTVFLDETNSFSIGFDYHHGGFVFIENENLNKHNPPVTFLFYAEPGDSLLFTSEGNDLPRNVSFGGTRVAEAELLDELRRSLLMPKLTDTGTRSNVLFDARVPGYGINLREVGIIGVPRPGQIMGMIRKSEDIILKYKALMPDEAYSFIANESKCYFYTFLFEFLRSGYASINYSNKLSPDLNEIEPYLDFIDKIDIHDIYNDYGLFSRTLTGSYLTYYFNKIKKVESTIPILSQHTGSWRNLEGAIQFGRTILVGSPLYREIAGQLDRELLYQYHDPRFSISHLQFIVEKHFTFMSKSVNDTEFLTEIHNRLKQMRQWMRDDYIPDAIFYDPAFQERKFHDYIGKKPAIFFVAQNWSNSRYSFDDRASENPDIHFVMVQEGSNFREWTEYLRAAEPVANQLFLLNDKMTLIDLFEGIRAMYIVYDKDGKLLGTTRLEKQALNLAKTSLQQKKEFNKSQLKWIIIGLSILTLALSISLFIWKWRARLRLRQEISARRLRELELTAIRSQMNPHFLFNSLNSLQNLVQQNRAAEALSYLSDFGGIIRKVLHNSEKQEIPLADELQMVEQYLKLEQLRFDFSYCINVENSIDIYNSMVPSMLLQPLAENAIQHGLQHKPSDRSFRIHVFKADRGIKIFLEDNGVGREASGMLNRGSNGKGLRLSAERLRLLAEKAGEKYELKIHDLSDNGETGTRVELFIADEN